MRATVNLVAWLRAIWPYEGRLRAVIDDYAAIGRAHPHFLADVALRGGVFRHHDPASDGPLDNFNGRRELALEIIKATSVDPNRLYSEVIEKKPLTTERKAA